jgi:oligoendopeptidase F
MSLKKLVLELQSAVSKLPSEHAAMTDAERRVWSVLVQGKFLERMQTAFRSLAAVEELFHELKPIRVMYEAYQRLPSLLKTVNSQNEYIKQAQKMYEQYKEFMAKVEKDKDTFNTMLNNARDEKENYKKHACGSLAKLQEAFLKLEQLTQERNQLREEHKEVPKGFKPRAGSSYRFITNPDAEVTWNFPLLKAMDLFVLL